jgi:hypothetical protein
MQRRKRKRQHQEFPNRQERELAERHLYLVRDTVLGTMSLNESIQGFGYDDLYQTGGGTRPASPDRIKSDGFLHIRGESTYFCGRKTENTTQTTAEVS